MTEYSSYAQALNLAVLYCKLLCRPMLSFLYCICNLFEEEAELHEMREAGKKKGGLTSLVLDRGVSFQVMWSDPGFPCAIQIQIGIQGTTGLSKFLIFPSHLHLKNFPSCHQKNIVFA